jgi:hypothetical protein
MKPCDGVGLLLVSILPDFRDSLSSPPDIKHDDDVHHSHLPEVVERIPEFGRQFGYGVLVSVRSSCLPNVEKTAKKCKNLLLGVRRNL